MNQFPLFKIVAKSGKCEIRHRNQTLALFSSLTSFLALRLLLLLPPPLRQSFPDSKFVLCYLSLSLVCLSCCCRSSGSSSSKRSDTDPRPTAGDTAASVNFSAVSRPLQPVSTRSFVHCESRACVRLLRWWQNEFERRETERRRGQQRDRKIEVH